MKTVILSALLTFSLFASASGTKEKSVTNYRLLQNFTVEFGNVENIKWSSAMNNMTKADFVLDEEEVTAFFDENGDFFASTKTITFTALPKKLQAAVMKKAPDARIKSVFEMNSLKEKAYFIETNVNNEIKVWKGNAFGNVIRYFVK